MKKISLFFQISSLLLLMAIPTLVSAQQDVITISVGDVEFKMIRVEGGTFTMGATGEEGEEPWPAEVPTHQVTLSTYYIGETEVTQELWKTVMGKNPALYAPNVINSECGYDNFLSVANRLNHKYPDMVKMPTREEWNEMMTVGGSTQRPVERINVKDCLEFIQKLNELTGKTFRLPTEAEWEYAARGGKKSRGYKYSGSNNIDEVAWYMDNARKGGVASPEYGPHPVKAKQPNELGIYDMSGNVAEWTSDGWSDYTSEAQTNPQTVLSDSRAIIRGGRWDNVEQYATVSSRNPYDITIRCDFIGLRLVLVQ